MWGLYGNQPLSLTGHSAPIKLTFLHLLNHCLIIHSGSCRLVKMESKNARDPGSIKCTLENWRRRDCQGELLVHMGTLFAGQLWCSSNSKRLINTEDFCFYAFNSFFKTFSTHFLPYWMRAKRSVGTLSFEPWWVNHCSSFVTCSLPIRFCKHRLIIVKNNREKMRTCMGVLLGFLNLWMASI